MENCGRRPGTVPASSIRANLPFNKLPPPVHIEQITADRKLSWQNLSGAAASNLRLPALSRDLEIDYTALSLVAPEKNPFPLQAGRLR